jgi:hypothetical protein
MKLFKYYTTCECIDIDFILDRLYKLENDGKIILKIDRDILKITDIDLDDLEISSLINLFDKYDVYEYPDYDEELGSDDYHGEEDGYVF